jgi:hypothetical protein
MMKVQAEAGILQKWLDAVEDIAWGAISMLASIIKNSHSLYLSWNEIISQYLNVRF